MTWGCPKPPGNNKAKGSSCGNGLFLKDTPTRLLVAASTKLSASLKMVLEQEYTAVPSLLFQLQPDTAQRSSPFHRLGKHRPNPCLNYCRSIITGGGHQECLALCTYGSFAISLRKHHSLGKATSHSEVNSVVTFQGCPATTMSEQPFCAWDNWVTKLM